MPKPDELIFALKTYAGAMAALFLALWLGLENPYWSMATAYIVAQPFTGAMRSKALFRFIGTLTGGIAAVILVPNLANAPLLLSLALALWIGLCLYISLLDRTPRAYMFMLAGYTAGIIGFPSVAAPGAIFQTALTRVEEISIGIACTTVIGTVFFPRPLGPVLAARIAGWVRPAIDWARDALSGRDDGERIAAARRRLAMEASDVAMMLTQLAFDNSELSGAVRNIARFRIYALSLMPVLSSISDRVVQLKRLGGITPELRDILTATSDWVRAGGPENADALHDQITALREPARDWAGLLRASLLVRLDELLSLMRHSRAIRRHVFHGEAAPDNPIVEAEFVAAATQLRDHGLAALSAAAAALAVLLVCAFWIFTGWESGAGAAIIVAVACSFFAAQDDPAPAIAQMIRNAVIVTCAAGLYEFLILPRVETFPELVLVLLPAGLIVGILVSRPATFGTGMVMGAFGSTDLAIGNGYAGDLAAYLNGAVALIAGLFSALLITKLIRSVGAAWSAERLTRAAWRDIAAAAEASAFQDRAALTGRIMDRLGLLMPRLAAVSPGADDAAASLLRDLRVGLNVIGLRRILPNLPAATRAAAADICDGVAALYRANPRATPPGALLDSIDAALRNASCGAPADREALMVCSGLRIVLFGAAPPPEIGQRLPELAGA